MKAKFGAIVVAGSGKLGGHVASRNRAGAYFRTLVTPVNPDTSFQQTARALLSSLAQSWRDLTDAERSAWNASVSDFAKTDVFGDIRNPTGFNLYVRLNANINVVGGTTINIPPLPGAVTATEATALVFNLTGNISTIAFTPTVPAGEAVIVRATPSLSPGISFVRSEYRIIEILAAAATSPADIDASYTAKFGAPTEGAKIFVTLETVNITTGQKSVDSHVDTIVINV